MTAFNCTFQAPNTDKQGVEDIKEHVPRCGKNILSSDRILNGTLQLLAMYLISHSVHRTALKRGRYSAIRLEGKMWQMTANPRCRGTMSSFRVVVFARAWKCKLYQLQVSMFNPGHFWQVDMIDLFEFGAVIVEGTLSYYDSGHGQLIFVEERNGRSKGLSTRSMKYATVRHVQATQRTLAWDSARLEMASTRITSDIRGTNIVCETGTVCFGSCTRPIAAVAIQAQKVVPSTSMKSKHAVRRPQNHAKKQRRAVPIGLIDSVSPEKK